MHTHHIPITYLLPVWIIPCMSDHHYTAQMPQDAPLYTSLRKYTQADDIILKE